jgi:hypothetical protein
MADLNFPGQLTLCDYILDHKRSVVVGAFLVGLAVFSLMYVWLSFEAKGAPKQVSVFAPVSGIKLVADYASSVTIGSSSVISVSIDSGSAITLAIPITITLSESYVDEVLIESSRVLTDIIQPNNTPRNLGHHYAFRVLGDTGQKGLVELGIKIETPRDNRTEPIQIDVNSPFRAFMLQSGIILTLLGAGITAMWQKLAEKYTSLLNRLTE